MTNAGATFRRRRASGLRAEGALLTGWRPALVNIVSLCVLSLSGLVYLLALHELSMAMVVGLASALARLGLVGGVFVWSMGHRARVARLLCGSARAYDRPDACRSADGLSSGGDDGGRRWGERSKVRSEGQTETEPA